MNTKGTLLIYPVLILTLCFHDCASIYQPTWESLDARPLPKWYDEAKFGIFIHWGVFSVPSFGSEWFWLRWMEKEPMIVDFMKKNYPPGFSYAEFAPQFIAEFFDPNQWADLFAASGARYVVLTAKHAEGFCNWKTKVSWNWNSVDVGPHRDLVGDFANAIRSRTKLHFGVYHALSEWFNPIWFQDKQNNLKTRRYAEEKFLPALYELVNTYKPELIWADHPGANYAYYNSTGFLAWLYNESPVKDVIVTNDRWGAHCEGKHGGYYTRPDPNKLLSHKWESYMKMEKESWGYRRNAKLSDYQDLDELIQQLVKAVSNGGNLLLNVGPTLDGVITPIFEERLRGMGDWLRVNGEAIYETKPWTHQNDSLNPWVWYTSKDTPTGTSVYAVFLAWPKNDILSLGSPISTNLTTVSFLGYQNPLRWSARSGGGMDVTMPTMSIEEIPNKHAWTLRLENLK